MPDKSDPEVAEALADYFNAVSKEFDSLSPHEIPILGIVICLI